MCIYIYIIAIILKWYTGTNWYQNISFHYPNWNELRYEIDSLGVKLPLGELNLGPCPPPPINTYTYKITIVLRVCSGHHMPIWIVDIRDIPIGKQCLLIPCLQLFDFNWFGQFPLIFFHYFYLQQNFMLVVILWYQGIYGGCWGENFDVSK